MADATSVPQEMIDLYEGKMNFILDRFRGLVSFTKETAKMQWILQVMDFGRNVHREHKFEDYDTYMTAAQFLVDCGLECLVN